MERPGVSPEGQNINFVDELITERRNFASAGQYVQYLTQELYQESDVFEHMIMAASLVERASSEYTVHSKFIKGMAFLRGEMVGLRVAQKELGPDFAAKLLASPIPLVINGFKDELEQVKLQAELVLGKASSGFIAARAYHGLIAGWQNELSANPDDTQYVRLGFGLVMYLLQAASAGDVLPDITVGVEELELFANNAAEVDMDWDAAFRSEFPEAG